MKMLQTGSRYLSPAPDIMTDKCPWRPRPPTFQQWVAPLVSTYNRSLDMQRVQKF